MDVALEEEYLFLPVVPASVGRKHVLFLPEIHVGGEPGLFRLGFVLKRIGLDEDGIGEHIDVPLEDIEFRGIEILAVVALDNLAVLAFHRGSAREDRNAVLGVVIENTGTQDIFALVSQLHQGTAELREVQVYEIVEFVARELCLPLNHPHVAYAVDYAAVQLPDSAVANQIGAVVQESGIHGLADKALRSFLLLDELGTDKPDNRICLLGLRPSRQ